MKINQIIAHLKMLGFTRMKHNANPYTFRLLMHTTVIIVLISSYKLRVEYKKLVNKDWYKTKTNHEQGLRYLAKLLYDIDNGVK